MLRWHIEFREIWTWSLPAQPCDRPSESSGRDKMRWAQITTLQGLMWQVLQEQHRHKALEVHQGQGGSEIPTMPWRTCKILTDSLGRKYSSREEWDWAETYSGEIHSSRRVIHRVVRLEKYFSNFVKPLNSSWSQLSADPQNIESRTSLVSYPGCSRESQRRVDT